MLHLKSISIRLLATLLVALTISASMSADAHASDPSDFGPNVLIFDPSMPTNEIQAAVDAITAKQVNDEMGPQRYALLFKPGAYGTAEEPLWIQVGYYTEVAGLGASPEDVQINGHVDVYNRCLDVPDGFPGATYCVALNNFWRSLSNLTINVTGKGEDGCRDSGNFWAASQAAPMRRIKITGGNLTLMDYCSAGPQFASGGYIADSQTQFVINGSQQQYIVRNSSLGGWSNGVWNQVFSGVEGAPAECFPGNGTCGGPYTTLETNPITREKPFLYIDAKGKYQVFVPAARRDTRGISWANGSAAGKSISLDKFFIARPSDSPQVINKKLNEGKNLIFTPGIYQFKKEIMVKRAGTVVLGLGLPTLVPTNGKEAMKVFDVEGVILAGFMIDAGPKNSKVLLEVGSNQAKKTNKENPTTLSDIFFRHGGATLGKATTALVVNSDNVLLDHLWVWRADHGNEGTFGWDLNTGDTGVIVNGDNVMAYGLFVEHYQKYEVIWNGNGGRIVLFQNEKPYDPPNQEAWKAAPDIDGWAALKVADDVERFNGYGMGSYSFFWKRWNQGQDIFLENAFEAPSTLPEGSLHNLLTIFLDPNNGTGGIRHVVNGVGGSSTIANPSTPVTVVDYPMAAPLRSVTDLTGTTLGDGDRKMYFLPIIIRGRE